MDFGILLLRSVVGLTMAAHGAQKLFAWFGGPGLDKVALGFEQLGFVPGRRHARLAGLAEVGAGLLLALGLFTPAAGALILALMLVAALSVHAKGGFFLTSGGYEYNLVLGIAGISLVFTGPGRFSLDALLGLSFTGLSWGLAAAIVGLAGGAVQLAGRRQPAAAQASS
ncbi:MAG: DoxX family membrane protein [Luteitalea sp.]|nr:DoxX family membrane protein [Luteitalea sp.]